MKRVIAIFTIITILLISLMLTACSSDRPGGQLVDDYSAQRTKKVNVDLVEQGEPVLTADEKVTADAGAGVVSEVDSLDDDLDLGELENLDQELAEFEI
ncbi:hypothetical protein HOK51_02285 [Candidatus Woesearchaeota archaeon]|jgi:hypothetical protein|nr:hypothetical protein [Candidatus Woesearchaeota archaeon]MBT6518645.1 hypothetical protein [Candidatus Woesearchaeota archaeon]MBT7368709.1 hypothetical protein [Candidatus Woesearchaeota archaeon]